jgi:hypothetical protein
MPRRRNLAAATSRVVKSPLVSLDPQGRLMSKAGMRLPIESHVLQGLRLRGAQTCAARSDHLWGGTFLLQPIG